VSFGNQGPGALRALHDNDDPGRLTPHEVEQLKARADTGCLRDPDRIRHRIKETHHVTDQPGGVKELLNRIGVSHHKVTGLPRQAGGAGAGQASPGVLPGTTTALFAERGPDRAAVEVPEEKGLGPAAPKFEAMERAICGSAGPSGRLPRSTGPADGGEVPSHQGAGETSPADLHQQVLVRPGRTDPLVSGQGKSRPVVGTGGNAPWHAGQPVADSWRGSPHLRLYRLPAPARS
jgi:hypothetical protein